MKPSDRYLKIVEWSEESRVCIGTCPGLMLGGVHGPDERLYADLGLAVDDAIAIYEEDGTPLPPSTAGWVTDRGKPFAAFAWAMAQSEPKTAPAA